MTIFGEHTVDELRDWIGALDYQFTRIETARAGSRWAQTDPAGYADWAVDWAALRRRYDAARAKAMAAIKDAENLFFVPDATINVGGEWEAVARSTTQREGRQTKGDLQDLADRLNVGNAKRVTFEQTPQPTAVDFDLGVYQAADGALRAVGLPPGGLDLPTKVAIGGVAAVVLLLLARR